MPPTRLAVTGEPSAWQSVTDMWRACLKVSDNRSVQQAQQGAPCLWAAS